MAVAGGGSEVSLTGVAVIAKCVRQKVATALSVPRRSPIQVLTEPDIA